MSVSDNFFASLDLRKAISELISHLSKEVQCQNIIWVKGDYLQSLIHPQQEFNSEQSLNHDIKISSYAEATDKYIAEQILEFSFPVELKDSEFPVLRKETEKDEVSFLVPFMCDNNTRILSYFLFEGVSGEQASACIDKVKEKLSQVAKHMRFCMEYWEAKETNYYDDLTDLYNQSYLSLVLDNEITRVHRYNSSFTVLFIDADHFKNVNDTNGHWVGSKVLIELGKVIKNNVRSSDYAFRYGGDEYVVVLVETNTSQAEVVGERIRKSVEETSFHIDGVEVNITVSIGVASYPEHARSRQHVIQMADEAMYYGKNKSRNIVYVAS